MCVICRTLCIWASFFSVSSLPRHLLHVRWMWGTSHWARQASAWVWWLCLQVLAVKHTWTRKTNTNFSRQPSSCTHNWHSPVFLPPLLPPQDICWNCTGSDQTPSMPSTAWHMQVSQTEWKKEQMHWDHHKCIFSADSLMVIIFFLFLMPNSPFDSVFSCDSTCLVLKPCKSLSFKALCGAHSVVSVQTEGEAPSVLI